MQPYELSILLDNIEYSLKASWEQTRFQTYIQAQTQSTKKLKPTDLISFSWDKEEEKKNTSISNEDVERLKNKAQTIINKNNGRFSDQT